MEVPVGTTLFEAAHLAAVPVASSCQAELVCGKCHMAVSDGAQNLSPCSKSEERVLQKEKVASGERISCVARVLGDVSVTTAYW